MDYYPNIDALVWFAREVLPLIRRDFPQVLFTVVGSKPAPEVRALADLPGVTVTGRVEDVRPYVWQADVSVAPIRVARGIQNKVLEAMAMGKPVVATPEAFEGIEAAPDRDLLVAPTVPAAFAEAVAGLLRDPATAARLAASARATVLDRYSWSAQFKMMDELLGGSKTVGP